MFIMNYYIYNNIPQYELLFAFSFTLETIKYE